MQTHAVLIIIQKSVLADDIVQKKKLGKQPNELPAYQVEEF